MNVNEAVQVRYSDPYRHRRSGGGIRGQAQPIREDGLSEKLRQVPPAGHRSMLQDRDFRLL
jgi:hypothetical protein